MSIGSPVLDVTLAADVETDRLIGEMVTCPRALFAMMDHWL